jgi:lysophospholipase L1-like esterase
MRRAGTVVAAAVLTSALLTGAAPAKPAPAWVTAWAQSQQSLAPVTLADQSVRMVTHVSQGGTAVRIRVQNTFGTTPLTVDRATVGHDGGGDASVTDVLPVTFDGQPAVTIPPGDEVWSDGAALATEPDTDVAVSMYVAGTVVPGQHRDAFQENYLTPAGAGDHTAEESGAAYTATVTSTYLVSAVDVDNAALRGTIVGYGSSVVDGVGSTNCGPGCTELGTNRRWTDDLARRVVAESPTQVAVANAGISGTTSAATCPGTPEEVAELNGIVRLDRDVLALHGVTGVVVYYGTNDLAFGCTAEQIVDSYRQVFARLRAAGIDVFVTPITPRPGYTDQNNLDRHAVGTFVKRWNTCSDTCSGVVDFDQVLRDPLRPNSIYPPYDNGDGVHANAAGQQALAASCRCR